MPTLTIQLPGLPSVEHIVREDAITLGRMKGNSIALQDSSVSLSHAKITRLGNDFFLKDLNSTNGTMLNGQSVTEARLRDGDQLKFGEVIAYFRLEPLAPPVSAPATAGAEINAAPKPVAQSVPTPLAAPATVPTMRSLPGPASLPSAPLPPTRPSPATRRTSLRMPLLIVGGAAVVAVAGVLAWKMLGGTPAPDASAPPVAAVAAKSAPAPAGLSTLAPAPTNPAATPPQDHALDDLVKGLKSPDITARRRAASAVYNLGPAAKPILAALPGSLTNADPDVRMWVALALVHNNVFDKATIPILIQTLRNENPTLRQVACLSLAMIPYTDTEKEPVVAALVDAATKDGSPEVSKDAMTALKIIAPDLVPGK